MVIEIKKAIKSLVLQNTDVTKERIFFAVFLMELSKKNFYKKR